jgi:hypothetical protein
LKSLFFLPYTFKTEIKFSTVHHPSLILDELNISNIIKMTLNNFKQRGWTVDRRLNDRLMFFINLSISITTNYPCKIQGISDIEAQITLTNIPSHFHFLSTKQLKGQMGPVLFLTGIITMQQISANLIIHKTVYICPPISLAFSSNRVCKRSRKNNTKPPAHEEEKQLKSFFHLPPPFSANFKSKLANASLSRHNTTALAGKYSSL